MDIINIKLKCPDCGRIESEPFDIGDDCLCGGIFEAYRVVEKEKDRSKAVPSPSGRAG